MHPARDLGVAQVRAYRFEDFRLTLRHGRRVNSLITHGSPSARMGNMLSNGENPRQAGFNQALQKPPGPSLAEGPGGGALTPDCGSISRCSGRASDCVLV